MTKESVCWREQSFSQDELKIMKRKKFSEFLRVKIFFEIWMKCSCLNTNAFVKNSTYTLFLEWVNSSWQQKSSNTENECCRATNGLPSLVVVNGKFRWKTDLNHLKTFSISLSTYVVNIEPSWQISSSDTIFQSNFPLEFFI